MEGRKATALSFIYSLDDCRLGDFGWSGTDQRRDLSNLFEYERSLSKQGGLSSSPVRRGIQEHLEASFYVKKLYDQAI